MLRKLSCLFFYIFFSFNLFSQEEVPFTIRYQNLVEGNISFVANNIVNRNTGKNYNEPYNKLGKSSKNNDQFEMQYIDIDNDKSTFSSSSASYLSENKNQEILFAGLYWSATYKYEIGLNAKNLSNLGNFERDSNFNSIKIKTPDSNEYQDITGKILFDGFKHDKFKVNSPYLCFYDLTNLVKKNPFGEYTVANIRATQGFIEGGVAGGWVLYFIYKLPNSNPKFITLYDGFTFAYDKPVSILLKDFLTPKTGQINFSIAMTALEGDYNIDGDNVRIKNLKDKVHFPISSKERIAENIFNSQITQFGTQFLNRNPASLNTLGFDVFQEQINNKNNVVIDNNTSETEIKITSLGDKVYVLNMAFAIDIDTNYFTEKLASANSLAYSDKTHKTKLKDTPTEVTNNLLIKKSNPTKSVQKASKLSSLKSQYPNEARLPEKITNNLTNEKKTVSNKNINSSLSSQSTEIDITTEKTLKTTITKNTALKNNSIESKVNPIQIKESLNNSVASNVTNDSKNYKYPNSTTYENNNTNKRIELGEATNEQGIKIKSITINIKTIPDEFATPTETKNYIDEKKLILFEEKNTLTTKNGVSNIKEREIVELKTLQNAKNIKTGYYIIVDVFKKEKNAIDYIYQLSRKNIYAGYFINHESKYTYVYLKYFEDFKNAETAYYSNSNETYFDDYWMLEVIN